MKINFLGDSITEGAGADCVEERYSTLVCKELNAEEYNFGIGGTRIARQKDKKEFYDEEEFIKRAEKMPKDADFTFVFGGTNDFGHGDAEFGDFCDAGRDTFCGAFKELVEYLSLNFPKQKICFILPLPRHDQDSLYGDGSKKRPIAPLSTYINAEKDFLESVGIDYLDFSKIFHTPISAKRDGLYFDGLHPNSTGHRLLADQLVKYLRKVIY